MQPIILNRMIQFILNDHSELIWMIIGIFFLSIGLGRYRKIWKTHESLGSFLYLKPGLNWKKFEATISVLPDENKDKPWSQIVSGMITSFAICMIIGSFMALLFSKNLNTNIHSFALTTASLFFGVLISFISFWTLWQTKRIEKQTGDIIHGFKELVEALSHELRELVKDFYDNQGIAKKYHRVYFITTNPFFGMLSERLKKNVELEFKQALEAVADCVSLSRDSENQFVFKIICGDDTALKNFHNDFYSFIADRERKKNVVEKISSKVSDGLLSLENRAGQQIFTRLREVPPTQFMIIGNIIYEWIIEADGKEEYSEVFDTSKKDDTRTCQKYIKTFEALQRLSSKLTTNVPPNYLEYNDENHLEYDIDIMRTIPGIEDILNLITINLKSLINSSKNISVFELGCGTGIVASKTLTLSEEISYIGIDFNKYMLQEAEKKLSTLKPATIYKEQKMTSIKTFNLNQSKTKLLIESDFNEIDFPCDINIVLAIFSLHHQSGIEAKKNLFQKIFNSLEKNGLFIYADLFTYKNIREAAKNDALHFHFLVERKLDENWLSKWTYHHKYLNHLCPYEDEISILKELNFKNVELKYQHYNTSLIFAQK
ncbi:MAG: class I SAM-dependent methyltransferase [Candidatus Omnitrophota bacterium]